MVDRGEQQVMAAITSGGALAVAMQDLSQAVFGVPVSVLLAAFAGAIISLTFVSNQGAVRALLLVAGGTVAGAYCAPLAVKLATVLIPGAPALAEAFDKPAAFLLGLGFQVAAPGFLNWVKRKGGNGQ